MVTYKHQRNRTVNSYIFNIALTLRYTFNIGKKDIKVREVKTDGLAIERTQ